MFLVASTLLCLTTIAVEAQTVQYWSGSGADGNWSTAANWRSGSVPATDHYIYFDTPAAQMTARYDLTPQAGMGHSLVFTDAAKAFTISAAANKSIPIGLYVEHRPANTTNWITAPLDFRPLANTQTGYINAFGGRLELLGDITLPATFADPLNAAKSLTVAAAAGSVVAVTRLVGEVNTLALTGAGRVEFIGHSKFNANYVTLGTTGAGTTVRATDSSIIEITSTPIDDVWLGARTTTAPASADRLQMDGNSRLLTTGSKYLYVGFGATLAVGYGANQQTAQIQAPVRMMANATFSIRIGSPTSYSFLHATSLRPSGALQLDLASATSAGTVLTLVQRDFPLNDPRYIFTNLPDGASFDNPANGRRYQISYAGGSSGNDIVLTDIGRTAQPPSAPTGLSLATQPGALGVSFNPPTNDGGAPVLDYRLTCTPGPFTQVIAASPSIISGLVNGTRYLCSVAARNSAGYSLESVVAAGVPTAPPSAPRHLSATAGNGSITLNWDSPTDNGGSAVLDYLVVCTALGADYSQVTTSTSATLPILGSGGNYSCNVRARNVAGAGAAASIANLLVTPAAVPVSGKAVLAWLSVFLLASGLRMQRRQPGSRR
ncbi:MAG: fibronectin type III domain-containing protein [Burkholderiales bacterium]|nr:fibronectin type III domain-containing protein [Burkholderiales bacterium]